MENEEKSIETFEEAKAYLKEHANNPNNIEEAETDIKKARYIIASLAIMNLGLVAAKTFGIDEASVSYLTTGVIIAGSAGIFRSISSIINNKGYLKALEKMRTGEYFEKNSENFVIKHANSTLKMDIEKGLNK